MREGTLKVTTKKLSAKRRKAGRKGGLAPHVKRGFQCITAERLQQLSREGVEARRTNAKQDLGLPLQEGCPTSRPDSCGTDDAG